MRLKTTVLEESYPKFQQLCSPPPPIEQRMALGVLEVQATGFPPTPDRTETKQVLKRMVQLEPFEVLLRQGRLHQYWVLEVKQNAAASFLTL